MGPQRACLAWAVPAAFLVACQAQGDGVVPTATTDPAPLPPPSRQAPAAALMPDLLGLPSSTAGRRLGELEGETRLDLGFHWARPVVVRCGSRPRTVVRQQPASGTPLTRHHEVTIRTAVLDLEGFRGPCEPVGGDLGPVHGPDATLARQFYRFAADPSRAAPFASGDLWIGIEDGPHTAWVGEDERSDLSAWEFATGVSEFTGPFSALDILAGSGGYYELHRGVAATCPTGNDEVPAALAGLRAISLTSPEDGTSACMESWAVTLFLDGDNRIRGVALRHGSP